MRGMREEENFDIPLTSLIDVAFQLLIFFLVATTFIRRETDHTVRLPESEAGVKAASVPDRLVVNIRADGTLVVNGMVRTEGELREAAAEFARAHPERAAVIRADGRVVYQSVMRVFGICRASGVKYVDLPVLEPESR
ncbi:MAG: biopolymer transporter ExbD [Planctomycetota bacterium]|jgi:biopolymer transport protein ExbD|nr:biopolymer transporter ExbD [Planctomycetota bacterium]